MDLTNKIIRGENIAIKQDGTWFNFIKESHVFRGKEITIIDGRCVEFPHMSVFHKIKDGVYPIYIFNKYYSENYQTCCDHATGSVNSVGNNSIVRTPPTEGMEEMTDFYKGSAGAASWGGRQYWHQPTHNIIPSGVKGEVLVVWNV